MKTFRFTKTTDVEADTHEEAQRIYDEGGGDVIQDEMDDITTDGHTCPNGPEYDVRYGLCCPTCGIIEGPEEEEEE
jgi:hypothetical protein